MRQARLIKMIRKDGQSITYCFKHQFRDLGSCTIKYLDNNEIRTVSALELFDMYIDLIGFFDSTYHSMLITITDKLWRLLDIVDIDVVQERPFGNIARSTNVYPLGVMTLYASCLRFNLYETTSFVDFIAFSDYYKHVETLYDLLDDIATRYPDELKKRLPIYITDGYSTYRIKYDKQLVSYLSKAKVLYKG